MGIAVAVACSKNVALMQLNTLDDFSVVFVIPCQTCNVLVNAVSNMTIPNIQVRSLAPNRLNCPAESFCFICIPRSLSLKNVGSKWRIAHRRHGANPE